MGAKRRLNGTSKVNTQTHIQINRQTYGQIDFEKATTQRVDALKSKKKLMLHKKIPHIGDTESLDRCG